jgi:hypothetical protein
MRVEICPAQLVPDDVLVLRLCGIVDAGVLHSQGSGLPEAASELRAWISPGLLARAAWSLPGNFWTEVGAGVGFPLERYAFYYGQSGAPAGDTQVSQVAAVGATLALGAGYRFP